MINFFETRGEKIRFLQSIAKGKEPFEEIDLSKLTTDELMKLLAIKERIAGMDNPELTEDEKQFICQMEEALLHREKDYGW